MDDSDVYEEWFRYAQSCLGVQEQTSPVPSKSSHFILSLPDHFHVRSLKLLTSLTSPLLAKLNFCFPVHGETLVLQQFSKLPEVIYNLGQ